MASEVLRSCLQAAAHPGSRRTAKARYSNMVGGQDVCHCSFNYTFHTRNPSVSGLHDCPHRCHLHKFRPHVVCDAIWQSMQACRSAMCCVSTTSLQFPSTRACATLGGALTSTNIGFASGITGTSRSSCSCRPCKSPGAESSSAPDICVTDPSPCIHYQSPYVHYRSGL